MYTVSVYRFKFGLNPINFSYHVEQVALQVARLLFVSDETELVEVWNSEGSLIYNRLKN